MSLPAAAMLLLVEDDAHLADAISRYLTRDGYRVTLAHDGVAAMRMFEADEPDLVILDLMLPLMDGWDVCRRLRAVSPVPIIMLTARASESDRVLGLRMGADDYVVKPFSPRELAARVRSVLRRSRRSAHGARPPLDGATRIDIGGLAIDRARRSVRIDGAPCALTAVQFDLLAALAREPGRVFTREQLLEAIHEHASEGYERTIDAHVKNLRRALGDASARPRFIGTVRGVGYKLREPEANA